MEPVKPKETGLTERDVRILRYMIENRFVTVQAVEERFWKGKGNRNQYRRLKHLRDLAYIEVLHGDRGVRLGYRVCRKAIVALKRLGIAPVALTDLRATYRSTYDHDETLLSLRNIFESSPVVSDFQPEHLVRESLAKKYGFQDHEGESYKVPDALFQIKTARGTFRVALELEIAVKSKARYRKAIQNLSDTRDWDLVFFVVSERQRTDALQGTIADVRVNDPEIRRSKKRSGFYFIALDDFLRDRTSGEFHGENKTFSLQSLQREIEAAA